MEEMAKFTMRDESFKCDVCGKEVNQLGYTARDHCPYCLHSKHVDINPGDRASNCHGILEPKAIIPAKKGNYKIVYVCSKCGIIKHNKIAKDDNFDKILEITKNSQSGLKREKGF